MAGFDDAAAFGAVIGQVAPQYIDIKSLSDEDFARYILGEDPVAPPINEERVRQLQDKSLCIL